MVTTAYEVKERLQDLLDRANLSTETNLIAMHLTEIEEEAINFLDQLTTFRAHARHADPAAAQEALVEVSLALQHMADHIQAVTPSLDRELGIDDND
jgi:septation ring formation regulator EzrA